jgi:TP901 family phage tail tape measure protein
MSSAAIRGGRVAIEIGADTKAFFGALAATQKRLQAFSASMSGLGVKMIGLGSAAAVPFAAAIAQSASFQDTMSAVGAVTDATGEDFNRLKQKALDLGASTSFTAQQVAEGMQALGQGGFTVEETLKGIDGTLLLARAGMLDLGTATGIAVSVLRSFKMPAAEAGQVADILAKAANSSNATVQGLGEALSTVGGIAYTAGTALEEVTAAIGLLADRGMQGSEAGTAMRRVLIGLAQEQDKLRDLGIEVKDPKTGKLKPLKTILQDLRVAMAGMDETDKIAKLSKIFDVFGANAVLQLMNAGGALEELTGKLEQSGGSAAKVAAQMDDNLGGSMRMFMSAVEGVALAIGEALTPQLREWLGYMTQIAAGLTHAVQVNSEWVVAIAKSTLGVIAGGGALLGLGLALKIAAVSVGGFSSALSLVIAPASMLLKTSSLIVKSFSSVTGAAGILVTSFVRAAAATATFAATSAATAVRYAASVAAMVVATLASTAAIAAAWIGSAVAGLMAYVAHFKALVTYYTGALAGITAITISRAGAMAGAWIAQAGAAVASFASTAATGLASYVSSLAAASAATVARTAAMAAAFIAPVAPILALVGAIAGIGVALQSSFSAGGSVASSIGSLFGPLSAGFQQVLADATKVFSDLWGIATETFNGISDAIMAGDMSLAFEVLWAGLKVSWLRGQQAVMSYVDNFVEYIQNAWGDAVSGIAKAMVGATAMIERAWITMTELLHSAFTTAINGVLDVWDTAVGAIQKAIAYIRSFFDKSIDYDAVKKQIDAANRERKKDRDKTAADGTNRMNDRLDQSRQSEQDAKTIIDQENQAAKDERAKRTAANEGERMGATAQAAAEQGNATARAGAAREGTDLLKQIGAAETPEELRELVAKADEMASQGLLSEDMLARIEQAIDNQTVELDKARADKAQEDQRKQADEAAAQAAADGTSQESKKIETAGTFSAAAAGQMFAGTTLAERTAKATEETARNTRNRGGVVQS